MLALLSLFLPTKPLSSFHFFFLSFFSSHLSFFLFCITSGALCFFPSTLAFTFYSFFLLSKAKVFFLHPERVISFLYINTHDKHFLFQSLFLKHFCLCVFSPHLPPLLPSHLFFSSSSIPLIQPILYLYDKKKQWYWLQTLGIQVEHEEV